MKVDKEFLEHGRLFLMVPCKHCDGTGEVPGHGGTFSEQAGLKNRCGFCNGTGQGYVKAEMNKGCE